MTKNIAVDIIFSLGLISQRAKTVFIALASFSNKDNTCFPSVATIAEKCGLSESTVHRAIADLVAMELVIKAANFRENNGCTSNLYTLMNPLETMEIVNVTPAQCQADRGEGVNMTGAIEYDNSFNKNNLTLSIQTDAREENSETKKVDVTLDEVLENCEFDYIHPDYREMFRNSVARLYYSEQLRVGKAILPRKVIHESLKHLNYSTIESAIDKLKSSPKREVKNSSAYLTVLLYNAITEVDIDWYCQRR